MHPIIQVRNLSKQYKIGEKKAAYGTLRDSIAGALRNPFRRNNSEENTIWALRDVSFDIMPGEVVGIIGRNGAGKSTLLKILSRITEPTTGEIDIYGRVGSLLEVGTGFHMELTGRENIFLNGAILGMRNVEIQRWFDEIVEFADVEKFLDTPVKHYSSGMHMRLAFAVAAHLDPEILIIDEVLAVGDAEFQKKCLGKMKDISQTEGKTVLFVSHNLTAITNFCDRCMFIKQGFLQDIDDTFSVIKKYLEDDYNSNRFRQWDISEAPGNEYIKLLLAGVNTHLPFDSVITEGQSVDLVFDFKLLTDKSGRYDLKYHLVDELDNLIFTANVPYCELNNENKGQGIYSIRCTIPPNLLIEGRYKIARLQFIKDQGIHLYQHFDTISFDVLPAGSKTFGWQGKKEGLVRPDLRWDISYLSS